MFAFIDIHFKRTWKHSFIKKYKKIITSNMVLNEQQYMQIMT
jgi:hypothetical protein